MRIMVADFRIIYRMSFIKVKRKVKDYGSDQPIITLGSDRLTYNKAFALLAELDKHRYVEYFVNEKKREIGLKVFKQDSGDDCYQIESKKSGGYRSSCAELNNYLWIRKISFDKDSNSRKFKVSKIDGMWVAKLRPSFEESYEREEANNIPSDASGIYRYLFDDEVVYIGKGQILQRLREPERKEWSFNKIEYSLIGDDSEQYEWENYWINDYREKNKNLRPRYNLNSGHSK